MELLYFSAKTLPFSSSGVRSANARITLSKAGLVSINQKACELIGLKVGDKVSLAQDKKAPENWYLFIDPNGFEVRRGPKNKGLLFNHRVLVKSFLEAFEKDVSKTHTFLIAGVSTTEKGSKTQYWGILV